MKHMNLLIVRLPSDVYKEFCTWLRECCGMSISELMDLPGARQVDAFRQFCNETGRSDWV